MNIFIDTTISSFGEKQCACMLSIIPLQLFFLAKQVAGLYLFSMSARGRGNYGNDYISQATIGGGDSEELRRIRLHNLRSREADRDACFDWK